MVALVFGFVKTPPLPSPCYFKGVPLDYLMPNCQECGKPLPMSVPWQKFCSEKGKNKRSICANRYAVKKIYHDKFPNAVWRKRGKAGH